MDGAKALLIINPDKYLAKVSPISINHDPFHNPLSIIWSQGKGLLGAPHFHGRPGGSAAVRSRSAESTNTTTMRGIPPHENL